MKRRIRLLLILLFFLTANSLQAQQHEPGLHWRTLRTEHFYVHFPAEFEDIARKVAQICEDVYLPVSRSLHYWPGRTHVVLHTRADFSNGFAASLPWRMELMLPEPQGNWMGSQDTWLRVLITHEFTHIVQFRKNAGLSRLTYPFFGEFNSFWQFLTPNWFIEGIATYNESRFTRGGRGRNPYHAMQMQATALSSHPWMLDNTNYPSRKRNPPGMQYVSGYHMAREVARTHGDTAWAHILDSYTRWPVPGFNHAFKKVTQHSMKTVYRHMLRDLKQRQAGRGRVDASAARVWAMPALPENQYAPRWLDENTIAVYRTGYDFLPEISAVSRNGEIKRLLRRRLSHNESGFAIRRHYLVLSTLREHIRFSAANLAGLEIFDLRTGKLRRLTRNGRLYSPDLSPDEKTIVAVQTRKARTRLVFVNRENGEITPFFALSGMTFLNPRWSRSGKFIACAVKDSTGRQDIIVIERAGRSWRFLYPPDRFHENNPAWGAEDRFVYFISDRSGVFNIWAVEIGTGQRWQVTQERFGAFSPEVSPGGTELAYSRYTDSGFVLAVMPLDRDKWAPASLLTFSRSPYLLPPASQPAGSDARQTPEREWRLSPYSPLPQILRPQGWLPYAREDENGASAGFFAMSEDVLHRHAWQGYLTISPKTGTATWDAYYTYQRWWPAFSLHWFSLPDELGSVRVGERVYGGWWRENGLELTISTPLTLESNVYRAGLRPYFSFIGENRRISAGSIRSLPNLRYLKKYRGFQAGIQFNRAAWTVRDVAPHGAIAFNLRYDWSAEIFDNEFDAHQFTGFVNLFHPTLLAHHQLQWLFVYTNREGNFPYDSFDTSPLGMRSLSGRNLMRLKLGYHFPLFYVEWGPPLLPVFVDYLAGELFFDFASRQAFKSGDTEFPTRNRYTAGIVFKMRGFVFQALSGQVGQAVFYNSESQEFETETVFEVNL